MSRLSILGAIGLTVVGVVILAAIVFAYQREPGGVREVMAWLFFGVGLGLIAFLVRIWGSVGQGNTFTFDLPLAAQLDLPATAIAGGAFGQYVTRRGISSDSTRDLVVLVMSLAIVVVGIIVFAFPPSAKFGLAIPTHLMVFGAAIVSGAVCTFISSRKG